MGPEPDRKCSHQQRDHGAGVEGQVLDDLRPPVSSDPQGATVDLLRQDGEDLYEERHGGDVTVVPGGGGDSGQGQQVKHFSSLEEQEEVGSYFSMSVWTLPFQEAICSARSAMASASWGGGGGDKAQDGCVSVDQEVCVQACSPV